MQSSGYIYTSLEDARTEIKRRWSDVGLKKRVEEFLDDEILKHFDASPRAVLSRDIITADFEGMRFLELSKAITLSPLFLEYPTGKFVNKNSDKYHLCKLSVLHDKNKNGTKSYQNVNIVNFNTSEGKSFNEIRTTWDEGLIEFHHRLLEDQHLGADVANIIDISEWFNRTRYKTEYYYLYFLALFICHGVLFENFLTNEEEKDFTTEKVLPSFDKLTEMFGVKPLIVPVVPIESETDVYWWSYPEEIINHLKV